MSYSRLGLLSLLLLGCDGELRFEQGHGAHDAALPHCARDEDCSSAALHCDATSETCVACTRDADCADPHAARCDVALHRCVGCGSDLDCGANETCLPSARSCVTRCEEGPSEKACPTSAPTCDEAARICVQCKSDEDCRAISDDGPYCERASGKCVFCTDDRQCPASRPRCDRIQHRCGQCGQAQDCLAGYACDPDTLSCK